MEHAEAPDSSREGGNAQQPRDEHERMAELELMFLHLVRNIEGLRDRHAELGRKVAALELERAVEAVSP